MVESIDPTIKLQGFLSKYTNYFYGYQNRFFVLRRNGSLSYYESEQDVDLLSNGIILLQNVNINETVNSNDGYYFEISVGTCTWFLRAPTSKERKKWIDAIKHYQHPDFKCSFDILSHSNSANELSGILSKWTGYIYYWQDRYFVLKNGVLRYHKTELGGFVCHGAIKIHRATIKSHPSDACRFDISVSHCTWYLKAPTPREKQKWVEALKSHKIYDSGQYEPFIYIDTFSDQSVDFSMNCSSRRFKNILSEIEAITDDLNAQIEVLQKYFNICVKNNAHVQELSVLDLKSKASTFHTMTNEMLKMLTFYSQLIEARENSMKTKLEQEIKKRQDAEKIIKQMNQACPAGRISRLLKFLFSTPWNYILCSTAYIFGFIAAGLVLLITLLLF